MTNDCLDKNDSNFIICDCCGKSFGENGVHKGRVRSDGTVAMCKTCNWIHRHGGLPKIDGFTDSQIRCALEFMLIGDSLYLNDLAENIGVSLNDAIELVHKTKVKGKSYKVRYNCAHCNKECEENASVYLRNEHSYCSQECYWNHKREIVERGENHSLYNRVKTCCTNCGKELYVTPYRYNETNSYGDNHNFCSQKCYWEYRSKYYIGDKSSQLNSHLSDEHKKRMRTAFIEWSKSSDRFESKIQLAINSVLDSFGIRYEREYQIGYYAIDNFLIDSGLMIEVMGDYWHASPLKYSYYQTLNTVQKRDVRKDKSKHTYIKNLCGVEPLYIWEDDVDKNIDMCKVLILKYISNNGVLDNYHSFNWKYENDMLKLRDDIIIPYQDIDINNCRVSLTENKAG